MLRARSSQLVIVDIQEKLAPAIHSVGRVIANSGILLEAARTLSVPVWATEQYPKGLGALVPEIRDSLEPEEIVEKIHFAASEEEAFLAGISMEKSRNQVVICGTESHICVQQTALGLREAGYDVAVVADACSSRDPKNAERAYARMSQFGVQVVTTEMVLFEWMARAATDTFRELSKLIK